MTIGGSAGFGGGFEPVRAGAEKAADEFIGPFGGGDVEDAGDHARFDERFHGAPADAGGVEDEHFEACAFEDFLARVGRNRWCCQTCWRR